MVGGVSITAILPQKYFETLTAKTQRTRRKITSPPALSSKLERVPKNYTIVDQRVSITLSTRLLGERDGVRGALSAVSVMGMV